MLHSKLAPSSAARRVACPGSRAFEERYPQAGDSLASREGTAAHWVAQQYLLGNYALPATAPNGEPITNEMLDGADMYEHAVKWSGIDETAELHIEERVEIFNVHPDCWGTPDCWVISGKDLHIFDYKYGHGYVEVIENWQLLEYASGIVARMPDTDKITMTIIQPRCYTARGPVRSWVLTREQLAEYTRVLIKSEAAAMDPHALCIPSPQCKHCSGRHACTALQNTAGAIVDVAMSVTSYELDSRQTAQELRYLRHAAAMIDARMTGLEEQAKSMITRGEYVPGFKLEPGNTREHWATSAQEVIVLGEMMGLDLRKPIDTITPAQARRLGVPEEILATYAQRLAGKLKLVECTDDAKKVFKK